MYTVFNILSINQELAQEFHRFFTINTLTPLFTHEHIASHISVSDNELRSIVTTGSKVKPYLELATFILTHSDNKGYNRAMLRIIDEPKSFTKLTTYVTRIVKLWETIEDEYRPNFWNIVLYDGKSVDRFGKQVQPVIFY